MVITYLRMCTCLLVGTSTEEDIAQFAKHYNLQKTLQCLSEDNSVGDLPVHLPKVKTIIALVSMFMYSVVYCYL